MDSDVDQLACDLLNQCHSCEPLWIQQTQLELLRAWSSEKRLRFRVSQSGSWAYLVVHPGKLASLGGVGFTKQLAKEAAEADLIEVLAGLVDQVPSEVEIVQYVATECNSFTNDQLVRHRCYEQAGLHFATVLLQMEAKIATESKIESESTEGFEPRSFVSEPVAEESTMDDTASTTSLRWERWSESPPSSFIATIEQSYEDTLDVPELNGVRSTTETLIGYASCGRDIEDPDWWLIRDSGDLVGCLLLTDHGETVEISYLGVVPRFRGKGMAKQAVAFAHRWAAKRGAKRVVLAVDCRNEPAIGLYRQSGYQMIGRAAAWFRYRNPQSR